MWDLVHIGFLAVELVLAGLLVFSFFRKNRAGKFIVAAIVALNFGLYATPLFYARFVQCADVSLSLGFWKCVTATTKQLVGDVQVDHISAYASLFPSFIRPFGFGAVLAVAASFYMANSVFGYRITNALRCRAILHRKTCDLVYGIEDTALGYAQDFENTVLLVGEGYEKNTVDSLLSENLSVLKRKFSVKLLKSKLLNARSHYNVILFDDGNFLEYLSIIAEYIIAEAQEKHIRFYVEVAASMNEAAQKKLTYLLSSVKDENRRAKYRESITLFSRDELIARRLVEEFPMTKYLPQEFFCEDASVSDSCQMQVLFLGMTPLSREIYKQFVIGHQFAQWNGCEYVAKPVSYEIYDRAARNGEWEFGGLAHELMRCSENGADYFSVPDVPYKTECHAEDPMRCDLKEIAANLRKENCYSFVFIDVGDANKNLELASRLKLFLGELASYHLFVCDTVSMADEDDTITEYGNPDEVLVHDIIVDETLAALARRINREYCVGYGDCDGLSEKDAAALCERKWYETNYFKRYSNISLASNLRLKLNLLGLDYIEDGKMRDTHRVEQALGEPAKDYAEYFERTVQNALLAQEHFRWNAYCMMNGYLPMRKEEMTVTVTEKDGTVSVKSVRENEFLKRHACLTDYRGLANVSDEIARRANGVVQTEAYTSADFDYYQYDRMLLTVAPKFFEENGISVVDRI